MLEWLTGKRNRKELPEYSRMVKKLVLVAATSQESLCTLMINQAVRPFATGVPGILNI
jgi:hypothetical protein